MRLRDSSFAIIVQHNHILLVKARAKENWQLPGGRLEPGESPQQALVREIHEETGLDGQAVRMTGIYRREDGTVARVYQVRVRGRMSKAAGEIVAHRWVSIREAKEMVSSSTRKRLIEGLSRILAPATGGKSAAN